ncbi:MAG: RNA methyltransferase [Thermoprotei archaeon]
MNQRLRVVFVGCETGENAGFLARTMKNFGFDELWFVNPLVDVKLLGSKTAMHALDVLHRAIITYDLDDALNDVDTVVGTTSVRPVSEKNFTRNYVTPKEFAESWSKTKGLTALLFGREGTGLNNAELDMCDFVVSIPTSEAYPALNISHSAAVILYELAVHGGALRPRRKTASRSEKELLVKIFLNLLEMINEPEHRKNTARRALLNMLGRSYVSKREAATLIGSLRRISTYCEKRCVD